MTGGDKTGGDKTGGDKTGGDKTGGDKTGGDKTGTNTSIEDLPGPDPNSETHSPALEALVAAVETAGPWPEEISFEGDLPDGDFTVSDVIPYDYCIGENDGNNTDSANDTDSNFFRGQVTDASQIYQDFCLDAYGDPDLRNGSYFNDTAGQFGRRTFADTGATGTPNRWRRGSVVSVCVERNDNFVVAYGGGTFRASWVAAQAISRAIDFWNKGLNPKHISLEFVNDCNNAVYVTQVFNNVKNAKEAGVLATTPYPPRQGQGGRDRVLKVWRPAFFNNFQNVLTFILSHELGHALGLAHDNCKALIPPQPCVQITNQVPNSVLFNTVNPATTITYAGPEPGDIAGANAFYDLPGGPGTNTKITLWPATRGAFINYPPLPKCKWILGVCYY
ncbi:hypothetical protein DB88DRAFT_543014 [Papiliotrema laurentii]|uniref:Peptidase metallopeptidase domain-containing protein n=1 Tax=Papiliotrema laurentii TaxID=5418 RepID=A0AAD9FN06_PAPLA|nr:hypothetical protein DB88DRAFT_543014 [Papiliotrema laurentii]